VTSTRYFSLILRRHMDSITWAEAFEKLIEAKGINPKPGRRWDSISATVATLAKQVGVPEHTARTRFGPSLLDKFTEDSSV